ncbi:MAG: hypothetical protein HY321_08945 [Armatimonadetes bacterium]|nr:hypothetical protein [Armatimonadota bacterium]
MGFFSTRNQPPSPQSQPQPGQPQPAAARPAPAAAPDEPRPFRRIRPGQPTDRREAGLSSRLVEGLLLKTLKQEGALSEQELSAFLLLPAGCFRTELQSLYQRQCLDSPVAMKFDLTTKGRELTHHYESEDTYVGPAPVSFQAYREAVLAQAQLGRRISQEEFDRAFAHMPAPAEMRRLLKEAFNAKQVMLLWGPPGNGKSLWSDSLHSLLTDPIILPHAFEFNNKVIQYFDPAFHKPLAELMQREDAMFAEAPSVTDKPDRRWLICRPPLVTVGTEFRVEHFEIAFDGKFHAPQHLKANNGIFIFDDLGRQAQDHNMILNQFIYPLEQQETIIHFAGGSSIRAPYKQRLILSTNLNFRQVIDDAFARRLLYQVLVNRPTDDQWKEIIANVARANGVTGEALIDELGRKLLYWFKRDGRVVRASDPRGLFRMVDATLDEGETVAAQLTPELWERVYHQYPASYEKDATGYLVEEATNDDFRAAVGSLARRREVDPGGAEALAEEALRHFHAQGRFIRPVDAGNLFAMADGAREAAQSVAQWLTPENWRRLLEEYPNFTAADAERMRGTTGLAGK